jgi:DNA-binding YbaB/EbfC family protein
MRRNFGGGNMNNLMKQAQKMQKEMEKAQQELAEKEVEAVVGGGAVKAVANGSKEITKLVIDPDVVDADDVEMLQDLVLAAVNEALTKAEEMSQEALGKITGGLKGLM